ncbi:hypothetical protein [Thermogymnomonas acidicola]|uniref:hypothetical protein n=1 Tax=Thermogymnomonas acidicola TaxID=399579 RepID=UPI001494308F|nr:hypothetical protein [Thermogymnomonas acidicola]
MRSMVINAVFIPIRILSRFDINYSVRMDEKISSLKHDPERRKQISVVSFVGFQKHLVAGFFEQAHKAFQFDSGTIHLFHSKDEDLSAEQFARYSSVRSALDRVLRQDWSGFEVREVTLRNIWDIRESMGHLDKIKDESCLVNLSAGPSVFAASAILWGLRKGSLLVGHVVERREQSLKDLGGEESNISIFSFIDLRPYYSYVYLDHMDKMILKAIASGSQSSNEILRFVHRSLEEHWRISLRLIQMRLNSLEQMGGLIRSYRSGKSKNYLVSDNLTKIIDISGFLGT